MAQDGPSHGWCSLRMRFEQRELELLRGAERLRGASMARVPRHDELRTALSLAKAGQKVGRGLEQPGATLVLEENELELLLDAVRFAIPRVQAAARPAVDGVVERDAALEAFPELTDKGAWRAYGLSRELEALAARLSAALKGGS
jgi:hypothetical protein